MLHFPVMEQVLHGAHNSRHSRFVIGAKKGGTIGDDDVLALVFQNFREILRRKDDILFFIQADVLPIIVMNHPAVNGATGGVRAGIHVGNETHHTAFCAVSRKGGHDIAVFIQTHLLKPQLLQFLLQMAGQHHLPRRAGIDLVILLVGLGVVGNIIFKPFQNLFCI